MQEPSQGHFGSSSQVSEKDGASTGGCCCQCEAGVKQGSSVKAHLREKLSQGQGEGWSQEGRGTRRQTGRQEESEGQLLLKPSQPERQQSCPKLADVGSRQSIPVCCVPGQAEVCLPFFLRESSVLLVGRGVVDTFASGGKLKVHGDE